MDENTLKRTTEPDSHSGSSNRWAAIIALVVFAVIIWNVFDNQILQFFQPKPPPIAEENIIEEPKLEAVISAEGFSIYSDVQPPYYGADPNKPVVLLNNEAARNPSWSELREFLKIDTTDDNDYLLGLRVCAEFAAELHNKAEAAGIRAAWIAIEFTDNSIGHALNAFETRDKGLVFVDSTGSIPVVDIPAISVETEVLIEETYYFDSNDKKAYVEIGKQYGVIGFDVKSSFDYSSYQNYLYKWERLNERIDNFKNTLILYELELAAYNQLVKEYELMLGGRTEIADDSEYHKLLSISDNLKRMRKDLEEDRTALVTESYFISLEREELGNDRYESLGIVKAVEIYW